MSNWFGRKIIGHLRRSNKRHRHHSVGTGGGCEQNTCGHEKKVKPILFRCWFVGFCGHAEWTLMIGDRFECNLKWFTRIYYKRSLQSVNSGLSIKRNLRGVKVVLVICLQKIYYEGLTLAQYPH